MRKPTQLLAPAFVLGALLLVGGYRLALRPTAAATVLAARAVSTTVSDDASITSARLGAATTLPDPTKVEAEVETSVPTHSPTNTPPPTATPVPTATAEPTEAPTAAPTLRPTDPPTTVPTAVPTHVPTATRPAPTATPPLVPPDHIVAPAIGLDAKVVTVGWHEVKDANGNVHTEWDVASYAVGWQKNSAMPGQPGNIVLAGHNNIEGEVFRNLEKFQIGDRITLYAGGRKFTYVVREKFVVEDRDVPYDQRVANAKWIGAFPEARLTMVSCWPPTNNTHRLFVIARPPK